jgi:hypothetical protein
VPEVPKTRNTRSPKARSKSQPSDSNGHATPDLELRRKAKGKKRYLSFDFLGARRPEGILVIDLGAMRRQMLSIG